MEKHFDGSSDDWFCPNHSWLRQDQIIYTETTEQLFCVRCGSEVYHFTDERAPSCEEDEEGENYTDEEEHGHSERIRR